MKKSKHTEPTDGALTDQMDVETDDFKAFQVILLNKARERSDSRKREIELLALKYKMEEYLESEEQEIKLPGTFLKQYLKTLKIPQKAFAEYIHLNPSNLSKLINGERPINYELAIILGKIFSTDPMLWIEIQAKNELNRIRKTKRAGFRKYSLNDLIKE